MPEAVRLVVWDLDETFWKGTVSEGGITEYVRAHHDMVVTLARRGILSSICSKNDAAVVLPILEAHGIREYFVFPSIEWGAKGVRLAALIEAVQLRPASVMFIDDNANNRAEAAALIPDLQVEDEHFLSRLLEDWRFAGKDDAGLTRLAQYRLLETRQQDQARSAEGNEAFLRGCDIRVAIEYDIEPHLDRAVELVQRTNQLNFTKKRLPEDMSEARAELLADLDRAHWRQAGLVKVADKYGDYGFVGFFMTEMGRRAHVPGESYRNLQHFCFSCRTLGMLIEQWVFEHLGRPQLTVRGEVLTDLSVPRVIDWVRLVPSLEGVVTKHESVAPELRVMGGCETTALSVYLGTHTNKMQMIGNFRSGVLFVRMQSAGYALSVVNRTRDAFAEEAAALGLPLELMAGDFFADAPHGTGFSINPSLDGHPARQRYVHKLHGWEVMLLPLGNGHVNFIHDTDEAILTEFSPRLRDPAAREQLLKVMSHIRENYESVKGMTVAERRHALRSLIAKVPVGSKLVFLLNHHGQRGKERLTLHPPLQRYNEFVANIAAEYPYVGTVCFTDYIENDEQIHVGGNHYDRKVYMRVADAFVAKMRSLEPRSDSGAIIESSPHRVSHDNFFPAHLERLNS